MSRNRYLVAYDIRDEARLRSVYGTVSGFGDRLQYSVYICDMTAQELIRLKWELRDVINAAEDSIAIVNLGRPQERGSTSFEFIGVRPPLPRDGDAVIV